MIEEIRKAIIELEKKNYKIDGILLNDDILGILENNLNRIYGENFINLGGINTLWGYEVSRNIFDNSPVVFRTTIKIGDILGSESNE